MIPLIFWQRWDKPLFCKSQISLKLKSKSSTESIPTSPKLSPSLNFVFRVVNKSLCAPHRIIAYNRITFTEIMENFSKCVFITFK